MKEKEADYIGALNTAHAEIARLQAMIEAPLVDN